MDPSLAALADMLKRKQRAIAQPGAHIAEASSPQLAAAPSQWPPLGPESANTLEQLPRPLGYSPADFLLDSSPLRGPSSQPPAPPAAQPAMPSPAPTMPQPVPGNGIPHVAPNERPAMNDGASQAVAAPAGQSFPVPVPPMPPAQNIGMAPVAQQPPDSPSMLASLAALLKGGPGVDEWRKQMDYNQFNGPRYGG